ncbi:hypothetical protein PAXINDRAFT_168510 [Paxillus involutus ATCC 200175]|nr:hypothetical protein PAXINDRAFT_168510 [Paxillus involutus ATCC 200175]
MKTLLEDNIQRDGPDEYKERVSKLEEIWVPDGSMTECTQRMDNILAELNKAIKDNAQLEPEKKIPWPLERDATIVHIERMQVYKKAITSAIYANYNDMDCKLEPKTQQALDTIMWFDVIETSDRQEFMLEQRQAGTCTWIFDEKICKPYHEWISATEGFLWLRGKVGSGKSVLAAAITDQIAKKLEKEEKKEERQGEAGPNDEPKPEELLTDGSTQEEAPAEDFLAFYFCDFWDVRTARTSTFLKSLFVQFLQLEEPDLEATFPDLVQWHADGLPPPTDIETLEELLLRAMRFHDRKTIIVDGLDEFDDVPAVLGCLKKILAEKNVRLLVASRPEQVIFAEYDGRPSIKLEEHLEHVNKDISESLMQQMMAHYRLQVIPPLVKQDLIDGVTKQAEGSFWYSQCILDSLHACRSVGQVIAITKKLPKDLDTVYEDILHEVHDRTTDVKTIVQMAVRWLGGTLRPLTLSQLAEAVKIELGHTTPIHLNDNLAIVSEGDMTYICGNLVKYDQRTRFIGLGNSTVREYLTKPPLEDERFGRYFFDARGLHKDLGLRSITYILSEDLEKTIRDSYKPTYLLESSRRHYIIEHCPMLLYVFDGGFEHLRYITQEDDEVINLLKVLQEQIPQKPDKYRTILDSLNDYMDGKPYEWIVEEQELVLGVLVRFGAPWMLKRFLLQRPDLLTGERKDELLARVAKLGRSAELREMLVDMTVSGGITTPPLASDR